MKSVYKESESFSGRRITKIKKRPIAYAAHTDSYIYSYYASLLYKVLEEEYQNFPLCGESVLAYRVFAPQKSNINFAYETFTYIRKHAPCDVIALDVEGFFDNLDHQELKTAWQSLLKVDRLPKDHYSVFKASTRNYGIELPKLRDLFGGEVRKNRGKSNGVICTPSDFRKKVVPELKPLQILVSEIKKKGISTASAKGIPQGLPISAVLANLYMLEADKELTRCIDGLGGIYRRYSDDILLVVPTGKGQEAEQRVIDVLDKLKLSIQTAKTKRVKVFQRLDEKENVEVFDCHNNSQPSTVSYLGFEFDGKNIFVRQSSISNFMIVAKRGIDIAVTTAKVTGKPLKKRKLYTRLTSLGYGEVYAKKITSKRQEELPHGIPRLGFFKYLSRAENITKSAAILKQKEQTKNRVIGWIKEAEQEVKNFNSNCAE